MRNSKLIQLVLLIVLYLIGLFTGSQLCHAQPSLQCPGGLVKVGMTKTEVKIKCVTNINFVTKGKDIYAMQYNKGILHDIATVN